MKFWSFFAACMSGIFLTACGAATSQSNLPEVDDFVASDADIEAYVMTISDIMDFYIETSATCLPALEDRARLRFQGSTYRDLAAFLAERSGLLYKEDASGRMVKEKKRTSQEYITAFNWGARLDETLPDRRMCFPSVDAYTEIGPLPRDYIARKVKVRKRGDAIREMVAADFDKLKLPEKNGLYLVTKGFELIEVPAQGEKLKFPAEILSDDMPERYKDLTSQESEAVNIWCIKHQDTLVSIDTNNLYGVFVRNGRGFPRLAFEAEALRDKCRAGGYQSSGYDDFVESGVGFGWRATQAGDTLIWLGDRARFGDVFTIEIDRRASYDETLVALFRVN